MEAVLLIVLLLFVAAVVLGGYLTVKAVGAAKRGVDRTISQARRSVEDTTLRARSYGQPGVAGELAQLRLRLRTSMRATQELLYEGVAADASLEESVRLFERLSAHGHELEAQLRQAERDPDRAGVSALMQELRDRTAQVTGAADSLRRAIGDRARKFTDDDLSRLSTDIEVESEALRHWTPVDPTHGTWGPAAGSDETAHDADAGSGPGELDPADPQRFRAVHPWQKHTRRRRPETSN